MRVIAGSARRLTLKTIEGLDTRPTTDRIKETLFNMLQPRLIQAQFLDLFSGSGAIGIEALSRGASKAVFIENNPKAVECIRENLKTTRLEMQAVVINHDVITGLRTLEGKISTFDTIFMDPPYHQDLEQQVLKYLGSSSLIDNDTIIIIEAALDTDLSYLQTLGFAVIKKKEYKTNQHLFVKRGGI